MSAVSDTGTAEGTCPFKVIDFDQHGPDFAGSPFEGGPVGEVLDRINSTGPVQWTEANGGFWVVSGYEEATEVARDVDRFSSAHDIDGTGHGYQGVNIPTAPIMNGFNEMDPPELNERRKIFTAFFSPRSVKAWRPEIEEVCGTFIDRVIESGRCDFAADLASPITAVLTMRMLGVGENNWEPYSNAIHQFLSSPPGSPDHAAGVAEYAAVRKELQEVLRERSTSKERPNDLVTLMNEADFSDGPMSDQEKHDTLSLFYAGSVDTTSTWLSGSIFYLAQHPEVWSELAADPDMIATAGEEFLRIITPAQGMARTATQDTVLGGQRIREGDRIWMAFAAANRNPEEFPDPSTVDITRFPNRHTAFGWGAHRCIGNHLARAIYDVVMRQVLERMPDLRLDPDEEAHPYPSAGQVRGWVKMPVVFTPGARRCA